MWVNLHSLPVGQHMYTIAVTMDPPETDPRHMTYDEVDVVASSRATAREVLAAAHDEIAETYPSTARVIGVSDQSDGYVMWQDPTGDLQS